MTSKLINAKQTTSLRIEARNKRFKRCLTLINQLPLVSQLKKGKKKRIHALPEPSQLYYLNLIDGSCKFIHGSKWTSILIAKVECPCKSSGALTHKSLEDEILRKLRSTNSCKVFRKILYFALQFKFQNHFFLCCSAFLHSFPQCTNKRREEKKS